jgi:TonB family protein
VLALPELEANLSNFPESTPPVRDLSPAPVRIGGNVQPPSAQSARVQGVVILEAIIGVDGRVEQVRVLRSIPLLDASAIEAVRQWQYTPTLLNGVPVPVIHDGDGEFHAAVRLRGGEKKGGSVFPPFFVLPLSPEPFSLSDVHGEVAAVIRHVVVVDSQRQAAAVRHCDVALGADDKRRSVIHPSDQHSTSHIRHRRVAREAPTVRASRPADVSLIVAQRDSAARLEMHDLPLLDVDSGVRPLLIARHRNGAIDVRVARLTE